MIDSDTSLCSAITQDYYSTDPFDISSSKYVALNFYSYKSLNKDGMGCQASSTKWYETNDFSV